MIRGGFSAQTGHCRGREGTVVNQASADAKAIFLKALDCQTPEELACFLEGACDGDHQLQARVSELLDAHRAAGNFLRGGSGETNAFEPIAERPGTAIGPYKLLQQIGEGGMGVVFMAEQTEPIQRTLALKIIKPGMDTRQVIARFEAERQAVAMMDHPNIAKVLDAGTTDSGRPYFVMELVKGVPITKYCDEKHLPLRARLELFVHVCQAVQHAHQKGIIHRDIKPNNVLVAEYDHHAIPKVIDFGVAKATAQKLTERTMFTEFGQVLGTMEYMSPEQSKFNQLDIDTRSDIYSLGVLLYELLAGSTPFEGKRLRAAAFDEMLRIIREEEPPKPSTRISSIDTLPSVAANRHTEPARLSKDVRGELDWIVMKALEKDRNRRYETASSFAADIERHLHDEPVEAGPPSATYRFRKFARRNKAAIVTASAVTVALLLAVAVLAVSNVRINREKNQKTLALQGREIALKDREVALMEKGAALSTAREVIDQMLVRIADDKLNDVPLANPLRKALLEDAIRFYEGLIVPAETGSKVRDDMLRVLKAICTVNRELGRYVDARQSFERYINLLDQLVAENPSEVRYRFDRAYAEESFAYLLEVTPSLIDKQVIEDHYRKAIELFAAIERDWPDHAQPMIQPLKYLAELANSRGDYSTAESLWREAIERGDRFLSKRADSLTDVSLASVENGAAMRSRLDVAEPQLRSQLCWASVSLGDLLTKTNRLSEAKSTLQDALRHVDILLKKEPRRYQAREVAASLNHRLAVVYAAMGRMDEANLLFQRAVNEIESLSAEFPWTRQHWQTARYFQEQMVSILQKAGRNDEARESVRQMDAWIKRTAPRVPDEAGPLNELLLTQRQLVGLLRSTGQVAQAEQLAGEADDLQTKLNKQHRMNNDPDVTDKDAAKSHD
jgi:serine/threonine protein kinase/tetratricopeptide (TPR) repeat protein